MILVGILDISGLGQCPGLETLLGDEETERLLKIKNADVRSLSLCSRILLSKMYEERYNKKIPKICYTEKGKPYFENDTCCFSISHSDNFVVVALNENNSVGVDIQSFDNNLYVRERLEKRFLSKLPPNFREEYGENSEKEKNHEVNFEFFEVRQNEKLEIVKKEDVHFLENTAKDENENFLLRWTSLEAILKLSGGGFGDLKNVNCYLHNSKIKTHFFQHGGVSFAVSVAFSENKN